MSMIHLIEGKVVVLGSQGVGKTSLVMRYVGKTFSKHVSPTIGASFFTCKMKVDDQKMRLQLWDTAGQERFRSMAPMYYRKANAAMIIYDITSQESFEDLKKWVLELKKNVDTILVLVVLGNKADLETARTVPLDDALEYAAQIGARYFETSALRNEGIDDVFLHVAHSLIKQHNTSFIESDSFTVHDSLDNQQQQQPICITADPPRPPASSCCL